MENIICKAEDVEKERKAFNDLYSEIQKQAWNTVREKRRNGKIPENVPIMQQVADEYNLRSDLLAKAWETVNEKRQNGVLSENVSFSKQVSNEYERNVSTMEYELKVKERLKDFEVGGDKHFPI